jgi:oligopeptide transport system ATP-binding protein
MHPYTRALLSAIPMPDPRREREKKLFIYDPAIHDDSKEKPTWQEIRPGHFVLANQREAGNYRRMYEG